MASVSGSSAKKLFHARKLSKCFRKRQAEAVLARRPRRHDPELHQVLGNHIEAPLLQAKPVNRGLGDGAERMLRLQRADE
jgi:hypothetical protein